MSPSSCCSPSGVRGPSHSPASGSNVTLEDTCCNRPLHCRAGYAPEKPRPEQRSLPRPRCYWIHSINERASDGSVFSAVRNDSARQKAFDMQAADVETEGREGVASSLQSAGTADSLEEEEEEEESAVSTAYLVSYFVAGGAAGAASRTVVSPLERLKSEC